MAFWINSRKVVGQQVPGWTVLGTFLYRLRCCPAAKPGLDFSSSASSSHPTFLPGS